MLALYIILGLIVVFLAILLIRTAAFKPKKEEEAVCEEITFDKDAAVDSLQALVRCATVSFPDPEKEDDAEFQKLLDLLPKLFPNVSATCEYKTFPDRGILYKWKGTEGGDPAVLMAHYDVVPVNQEMWEKPAFEGIIEDGVLWGRGTLDTKVTFNGILSGAENLIKQGFTPKHDIYFAFSGGEEVNGRGAVRIVDYFKENGITPYFVLDEGGAVVEGVFPGVSQPCGLIGIAEKGQLTCSYTIESNGGHASAPPPVTPIGHLSKACAALEAHPFPAHFTTPVLAMFDTLGRHSSFVYRLIFANLWCFKGILDGICKKSGGELNALVRTTVAFTQMSGSQAANVLPPVAQMVSNLRLNPADSVASARAYIEKTIANDQIKLDDISTIEPSPISTLDCDGWNIVSKSVADTWKGCLVSPYLMVQCSDSRHYGSISDKVYRFSAQDMTAEERKMLHGNNERIRLEVIHRATEFFIRVMKSC